MTFIARERRVITGNYSNMNMALAGATAANIIVAINGLRLNRELRDDDRKEMAFASESFDRYAESFENPNASYMDLLDNFAILDILPEIAIAIKSYSAQAAAAVFRLTSEVLTKLVNDEAVDLEERETLQEFLRTISHAISSRKVIF